MASDHHLVVATLKYLLKRHAWSTYWSQDALQSGLAKGDKDERQVPGKYIEQVPDVSGFI